MSSTENLKIVVVGDGGVGKTALLISYTQNTFEQAYLPTIFDNFTAGIDFKGRLLTLSLWDTAGQEEYSRLRALSYPETNLFFICFDINELNSLENVKSVWYPELTHHCPEAKVLLVGTKGDLRDSASIPLSKIQETAAFMNAKYCECSAKTQEGLHEVFETGLELALQKPVKTKHERKRKCKLL